VRGLVQLRVAERDKVQRVEHAPQHQQQAEADPQAAARRALHLVWLADAAAVAMQHLWHDQAQARGDVEHAHLQADAFGHFDHRTAVLERLVVEQRVQHACCQL
jgi:hypothetical protein